MNVGGLRHRLLGGAATQVRSLAVLPLVNLSGDADQEYFADGMTEELITNLGRIGGLRVISRSSVMTLKHAKKTLPQMARALNVDALIEGSVARSGDRVRIMASLVEANPERQLWSDSYEREAKDILSLQTEVAGAIARQIRLKVASGEQGRPIHQQAVNPAAYEAYLRGRSYLRLTEFRDYQEAMKQFKAAIEMQPTFAQAWAGLASAHYMVSSVYVPPRDAMPKVREAAERALELDGDLSEAHALIGAVSAQFEWNWAVAEEEFRTALRLNPSDANAHLYYSFVLLETGRFNEAISHARRAHDLDPLSSYVVVQLAQTYYMVGMRDSSLAICERLVASEPGNLMGRAILIACYSDLGWHERAITEAQKVTHMAGGLAYLYPLAGAYARAGRRNEAFAALKEGHARLSQDEYSSPAADVTVYALLGYKDRAFACLEQMYEARDENLGYINVGPALRPLRSDPRFDDLLRRIRLRR